MGGVFSIALYTGNRPDAEAASTKAFAELRRLDRMLSNYRTDSEWSQVNRNASAQAVRVSQELFDLLSTCFDFSRRSEGAFDITVGPLMKAWDFHDGSGRLADDAAVKKALASTGYENLQFDPACRTVKFARAGVEIDPGGIGKGYAVDRMIEVLKSNGIRRALVSAAGSSIYALGAPPGSDGWKASIRVPNQADPKTVEVLLKDASLSTSGESGKSFRANGRSYGHILDPRTGYPARGGFLAAVLAPKATDSEAWTKMVLVNGRNWTATHLPAGFRVFLCDENTGSLSCAWLP